MKQAKLFMGNLPRVAVVGAGAVGGYFGGMLARAGVPVVMIGRESFVEAVARKGIYLDTSEFKEYVPVEASTHIEAVQDADIVLYCVKTTDNVVSARSMAPFLKSTSVVLSLQNGVDNVAQLRAAAGIAAYQAVVYVAASVPEFGYIKHAGRGDLVMGPQIEEICEIAALFTNAGVPCRLSDNIEGELWTKLIWNCALNAVSALGHAKYGRIAANADARDLVRAIVAEVLAVARPAGVTLPGVEDLDKGLAGALLIATQMAQATSSTAQDLSRGKSTEIDSLNGFIVQRGLELNVSTPVNHALYTLVKLVELG
jgi:2-dehydropantoate 2-reductase